MNKKIIISEQIWKEGNMYTAYCPELDVGSCGETVAKAQKNLREALEIFIDETARMGTLEEILEEAGYDPTSADEILIRRREIIEFDTLSLPIHIK